MEGIRAGRCVVCKMKGCQARNYDNEVKKVAINSVQVEESTDTTDEDFDVSSEN